jgi:osmotically-inducible protein OsmY
MKSDEEIREDVIRELRWDPQLSEPEAIGVAVKDGAVTLTGHAPTYGEKLAAARAAARVYGVRSVADDIKVRLRGDPRDDQDIAEAIAHVLENNTQIPEDRVKARVQGGWVTLEGEVDYEYQRREVDRMVRNIRGVIGITNTIRVSPPSTNMEVLEEIQEAFRRESQIDPRHIRVEITDHTARLYGHVHSLKEATAATEAAASAPGVSKVESHIVVEP